MPNSSASLRAHRTHTLLAISAAAVAVATLAPAGCYNPTIAEGFKCNTTYEPGAGDCPDGFHCGPAGLCLRGPAVDAAVDQGGSKPETRVDGPVDMPSEPVVQPEAGPDLPMMCNMPVAGCTADTTKKCDPVCQTGCGCHEKCSASTAGALTCNPPRGSALKAVGESCVISASGTVAQSDDCKPGLVCVADGCGGGRCYRFCRADADCPGSACSRDAGGGVEICDVPFAACDPIGGGARAGCPSTGGMPEGCYLAGAAAPDQTLCDCPFGAQRENDTCVTSRDCLPGLVCVDPAGTFDLRCQPVWMLQGNGGCSNSRTCVAIGAAATYGYCRP